MKYINTRDESNPINSSEAIKNGLAPGGGLYMPQSLPFYGDIFDRLIDTNYAFRASEILSYYLTDYLKDDLTADCKTAYSQNKFTSDDKIAPVVNYNSNISILELFHGPTSAFKDMALQLMPHLVSRALPMNGENRTMYILTATSGDTGKAALEGFRDVPQVKINVFYPAEGVSYIQKLQMATQEGNNVNVCAVKGNFDDTQNGVKKIFGDKEISKKCSENGIFLSSANSINWGRLAPQIVYYVSAYCDLIKNKVIKNGDKINVCVPTGNFGNILAAYLAKRSGLPIDKFICASNTNNILTDFFNSGVYDIKRIFHTTISPSMDILISSNLERLLYLAAGCEATSDYMKHLKENGIYKVPDSIRGIFSDIYGMWCGEEDTKAEIKKAYNEYGYLCDPHTAVGLNCARRYIEKSGDTRPMLTVSTASPYKFASSVYYALTDNIFLDEFKNISSLASFAKIKVPAPLEAISKKEIRFDPDIAIETDEMADAALKFILN